MANRAQRRNEDDEKSASVLRMGDQKRNDREKVVANAYIKSGKDTHTLETKRKKKTKEKEENKKRKMQRRNLWSHEWKNILG